MKYLVPFLTLSIALPIAVALPLAAQNVPSLSPSPPPSLPMVNPSSYPEYMRLGYAAMKRKDYSLAANYFRQALYYNPQDREATIAYWNARDALNKQNSGTARRESDYDRYMRIGYDATKRRDYNTAYVNFERALQERPGNTYATQALRNVSTYIAGTGGPNTGNTTLSRTNFGESPYDRYMRLGYAAQQRQDNETAYRYFLGALYEKPNDRLATLAVQNAQNSIARENQQNRPAGQTVTDYDRYMQLGYEATERGKYSNALTYFNQAMRERPGDEYATRAIRNVRSYIELGRANPSNP
ncbi:tetratricopeptide repeat protein [Pannus brasiliensis CCIBt3594]|uniref:Tetratricopeptide repeat protein n=1 Tax=Pannus brasiliensis CCIBt3594 TaxID=1427578 RepID=A0AAW9QZK8_9CHRO